LRDEGRRRKSERKILIAFATLPCPRTVACRSREIDMLTPCCFANKNGAPLIFSAVRNTVVGTWPLDHDVRINH
jgi:hypothetical protein